MHDGASLSGTASLAAVCRQGEGGLEEVKGWSRCKPLSLSKCLPHSVPPTARIPPRALLHDQMTRGKRSSSDASQNGRVLRGENVAKEVSSPVLRSCLIGRKLLLVHCFVRQWTSVREVRRQGEEFVRCSSSVISAVKRVIGTV